MTIKKLTVAAALAVGITTCSLHSAMAACPCQQQLPVVSAPSCGCAQEKPVVTGAACPCETQEPTCEKQADPACALCPGKTDLCKSDMKQVYAYPRAIYGNNNYIGSENDFIYRNNDGFSVSPRGLAETTSGATVATDKNITGAAADIPCLNEPTRHNGIPIMRDECKMDGNCTPIQMQTENSMQAIKKTLVPFEINQMGNMTGGAAGMDTMNMFPDVPDAYWAACDISKLAMNDVVVGYPDRMFRPAREISRAEFATMLVKGFNKEDCGCGCSTSFKDVPSDHWANSMIAKAVNENLMKGYPNNLFKPNNPVTRIEAICAMSKALNCNLDECQAKNILSKYCDGNKVPEWAQVPIAKALDQGILKNTQNPNMIEPFKEASRAEISSMLQAARLAGGYDKNPTTANECCPVQDDRQAYVENQEIVKLPTLQLEFKDEVNAKSSHVGQRFAATTLEDVTIDGQLYPCGSKVIGKVVEVIRPSGCQKGALKLAFTEIENCGCKATLPKQILTAQIDKSNTPNIVSRLVSWPLTWAGSLVGVVGRTTGGMLSNLGNAAEDISSGVGIALGETFQGQFGAAGRSLADAVYDTVKAPIDLTRTAISGTTGLLQTTGDEVAYLVDAKGYKISAINPKEHVTIAFGCSE